MAKLYPRGRQASLITVISGTLIVLLLSNLISSQVLQTYLYEVEAQPFDTSLKGKIDDLGTNAEIMAKKLREVEGEKIPNHYIVVLKDTDFLSSLKSPAGEAIKEGAAIQQIYNHALRGFAISVPNDKALLAILKNPQVDYVQPDTKVEAFSQSLPTGINRVDGDLSSTKSGDGKGSVNIDIGIMDTGIDLNHPDLSVYRQVTFVSGTSTGNDDNGHGTSVAGIAAAKDDSQGVVGLAPGARLWSIKVLDRNGIGSISNIIKGIDYVTQHANEIDVVNLSFGGDGPNDVLHTAIINSVAAGVTYAAAAGNEAKVASSVVPASFPEVIAVSAIVDTDGKCGGISTISTTAGKDDTFASFSNFGSVIDIAAPGVLIKTTMRGSSYTSSFTGTSASTPHVTGAAALYKSEHPGATPSDVRDALRSLGSSPATTCDGNGHGYFIGDRDNIAEPLLYTPSTPAPTSCTTNLPITVTASGNDGNVPANVLDNNLATRWSSNGVGQFITANLGTTAQTVCSVDIAWYNGNARQYHFVISTSSDGNTFSPAFSGDSSGTTLNSEKYSFAPVANVKFVRVTVNGNTANTWASITELDVFGSGASPPPAGCTTNIPITVTASDDDGNVPQNVLDNNLATRWSSLGVGQYINADLGTAQTVCSVDIAWYKGNERVNHFVISTSDGTAFTPVFSGDSSGTTLNSEKYTFNPVDDVLFIRVTVNGNTVNTWASITELDIFGSSSASATSLYSYGPSLTLSGPSG